MNPRVELASAHFVGRQISTQLLVEFSHCDMLRHMTSHAYLEVAINHRIAAVRDILGMDTLGLVEETGIAFVAREIHLDFQRSAQLGDWIAIHSWIDQIRGARMVVKILIEDRATPSLCCGVTITSVTIDVKRQAPVMVPRTFLTYRSPEEIAALPWAPGHAKT